jgi:hypothetical protein
MSGIWSLGLPVGALSQLKVATRLLAGIMVILWAAAGVTGWGMARAWAIVATVGAITCWVNAVRDHAERRALLAAIRELTRRDPPSGPLRAVS